ncbi:MAG: histidinol-phosphate transaminase [Nitrospirota bacterium]|nr:MAG: histidinol-phosphate transaminase [Nitrospirota bacterium]
MDIEKLAKKNILKLRPYEAKEIECSVKLDANESPYGISSSLRTVLNIDTNRYPDPEAKELRTLLARSWKVRAENILHGNGSDELIYYLINAFGGPVMFPVPTFSMYEIIAKVLGQRTIGIRLNDEFELDTQVMLRTIKKKAPRMIFLSSPNNPTGNSFDPDIMERMIKASRGIVVIDEAYQPFSSQKSFMPMIKKYPNLIVMRTLSKIGLAALRSGFIVGSRDAVDIVNRARLPFNVNSLSQAVAVKALENRKTMDKMIGTIIRERKGLYKSMSELEGVRTYRSDANFILFRVSDAEAVYKGLLKRGVLVRNLSGAIEGCLRVTVGTPKENRIFIRELIRVLRDSR